MQILIRHSGKLLGMILSLVIANKPEIHAADVNPPPTSSTDKTNSEVLANYKKMSLEELLEQQVTIVSKTPEKLSESPSAVQVITGEDIRRSGAMNLPEALRLAPNLEVAQVNSHDWAISARGFNTTLSDKLLVMIDGRTVYTPLDAGVFWDVQNVLLEDVDRIEVVSGPGGTLWGANAVNGVINIISKSAKDTQGTYLSSGGGSILQDFGAGRYGGQVGTNLFYRVYAQRFDHDSTLDPNGSDATNSWDMTQGGFRMDYYPSDANTLTLQGDVYAGSEEIVAPGDTALDGENILGRWTRTFTDESDLSVQMYFDRTSRYTPQSFADDLKTYDLDFQHRFPIGERQSFIWGLGYRLTVDEIGNNGGVEFLPADQTLEVFSAFAQDEIMLVRDRLNFTIGTKIEHNDFSGFEVQPSGRLTWTPTDKQTIWTAISRNVRSPSRIDTDLYYSVPPFTVTGNPDFNSEKEIAYELGYRVQPWKKFLVSASSYYNYYTDLRSVDLIGPSTEVIGNDFKGETYGLELSATYQMTDRWRLRGGYNYLHKRLWPSSPTSIPSVREGNDPANQFSVQSILDLPLNFQLDVTARYVDTLPAPSVPSYFNCDVRLAWTYKNWLEFSLTGENLVADEHVEFGAATTQVGQEIPRSVFGKVTCRF